MSASPDDMTLAEFDDGLLRWGSDLARWPSDAGSRAAALLAASAEARDLLAEEARIAAATTAALSVPVAAGPLSARVETFVRERQDRRFWPRLLNPLPLLAGAAAALALGAALALVYPAIPGIDADALLVTAMGGGLI